MSTPSVPHRFEYELVVHGTADQVWEAIATAAGISSWMLPTELDPRVGGAVVFLMAPGEDSRGVVTGYEPNRRIAYEEDWATLAGHPGADVTPLTTEFLIEAQSGGTCVVRVVSSAFGTGADWEHEFGRGMDEGWAPMLRRLPVYVAHFAGEHTTPSTAHLELHAKPDEVVAQIAASLGSPANVGASVDGAGIRGVLEQRTDRELTVVVESPFRGMLAIGTFAPDPQSATTYAMLFAYTFGDGGGEQLDWAAWLEAATTRHG